MASFPLAHFRTAVRRDRNGARTSRVTGAELFLLPVRTRVPLKFGAETLEFRNLCPCSASCTRSLRSTRHRAGARRR